MAFSYNLWLFLLDFKACVSFLLEVKIDFDRKIAVLNRTEDFQPALSESRCRTQCSAVSLARLVISLCWICDLCSDVSVAFCSSCKADEPAWWTQGFEGSDLSLRRQRLDLRWGTEVTDIYHSFVFILLIKWIFLKQFLNSFALETIKLHLYIFLGKTGNFSDIFNILITPISVQQRYGNNWRENKKNWAQELQT